MKGINREEPDATGKELDIAHEFGIAIWTSSTEGSWVSSVFVEGPASVD